MKPLAVKLAEKFPNDKIIILDLPFHGCSIDSATLETATVHTYTEVVKELIDILKEDGIIEGKLHWLGWSMSGSIGLLLELGGVAIDELTLLNSSPVWESIGDLITNVPAASNPDEMGVLFHNIYMSQLETGVTDEERAIIEDTYLECTSGLKVMVQDFSAITPDKYNVVNQLENVKAKTLIIGGTTDLTAEERFQNVMLEKIPDAELIMTEDNHSQLLKPYAIDIIAEGIAERFGN